jgi:hypothetical protein
MGWRSDHAGRSSTLAGQRVDAADRGMSRRAELRRERSRRPAARIEQRADPVARRFGRFVTTNAIPLAAFLAAVHLILALVTFLPQPHTGGDSAAYITLGRSLLERGALLSLWDPAEPMHTQYPPAFPGILAVSMAFGLEPWTQLKLVVIALSVGAVTLSFLWLMRRRRPLIAIGAASILAFSPGVLEQSRWVLSDVPFWFLTMLAVWSLERVPKDRRAMLAVGIVAILLAYLTRSAGLPLVLAAASWLALRRRWKPLAVLAAAILPFALWWWLRARSQGGVDYVSQFWFVNPYQPGLGRIGVLGFFDRIVENATKYVTIHLPILLTGTTGALPLVLSAGTFGFGIYGWARRLRRPSFVELFTVLYLGLILVWPAVWSGERFLLPAMPVLLYYAADGLTRLAGRVRKGAGMPIGIGAALLILLGAVPAQFDAVRFSSVCMYQYRGGDRYPCMVPAWRDFFDVGEWAATALPDSAAVVSRKPRLFYVISDGHPGINYPMTPEPGALIRAANEAGARHVVFDHLDGLSQAYLGPAVLGRITAYCIMHESPRDRTLVLGILPGADTLANTTREQAADASIPQCAGDYWRSGQAPPSTADASGRGP